MHYTHGLLFFLVGCMINTLSGQDDILIKEVVKANWKVGLHTYKLLTTTNPSKSTFYSPYSLTSLLFALMMGSKGETLDEMKKATGLNGADFGEKYHLAQAKLYANVKENKNAYEKLIVAKRFYYDVDLKADVTYVNHLQSYYQISAESVKFSSPNDALGTINRWVATSTENLIDAVIPFGDITDQTKFLAVSGIYFQPKWQYGFDASLTKPSAFKTISGITKTFPFMESTGAYNYHAAPEFKATILELPLETAHYAMYLIKPEVTSPLGQWEETYLTTDNLKAMVAAMKPTNLKLHLPKFTADMHYELSAQFKAMGVKDAFNPGSADFEGIFGKDAGKAAFNYYFTEAHFMFTEQGSPAKPPAGAGPAVDYKADTPFMFAIICKHTKAPYFMGRFTGLM